MHPNKLLIFCFRTKTNIFILNHLRTKLCNTVTYLLYLYKNRLNGIYIVKLVLFVCNEIYYYINRL